MHLSGCSLVIWLDVIWPGRGPAAHLALHEAAHAGATGVDRGHKHLLNVLEGAGGGGGVSMLVSHWWFY